MDKNIIVDAARLESVATKIDSLANDYKKQYEALYADASALSDTWKYEDNNAFVNQVNGFKDDLGKMEQLMHQYAEFLKKSAKAYRDNQSNVVAQAKKLVN